MSRNVTVGFVQMDCELMNKKANLEKMLSYVKEAAEKKVNLLCFPELCSTGYSPELIGEKYLDLAEEPDGETFQLLSAK